MNWRERWLAAERHELTYTKPEVKHPVRMDPGHYLLAIARIDPARVRRVPAAAIVEQGVDDDGDFSLVACPCGARPVIRLALIPCSGSECERWYVQVETSVWVTYGAMTPPPLPPAA